MMRLHLCNDHIRQRLPFSGRLTLTVTIPSDCDMDHPELTRALEDAVRILNGRPIHA